VYVSSLDFPISAAEKKFGLNLLGIYKEGYEADKQE